VSGGIIADDTEAAADIADETEDEEVFEVTAMEPELLG
jgi:hypothetical protein